ncbi:Opsin Rh3, partial [Gryllus bimaculatus]
MCMSHETITTKRSDEISHYYNITSNANCTENAEFPQCLSWELDISNVYHPVISALVDSSDNVRPNFSDHDFLTEIWIRKPDWQIALTVLAFLPFVIVGVFGNALIIYAVVSRCVLRTSTNLLLANMAAADAATLLVCPALFVCTASFQNYILGKVGCKMEGFIN